MTTNMLHCTYSRPPPLPFLACTSRSGTSEAAASPACFPVLALPEMTISAVPCVPDSPCLVAAASPRHALAQPRGVVTIPQLVAAALQELAVSVLQGLHTQIARLRGVAHGDGGGGVIASLGVKADLKAHVCGIGARGITGTGTNVARVSRAGP